jgi:hypothetical protein
MMSDNPFHRTQGPSWSRPMTETNLEPVAREAPRPVAGSDDETRAVVTRLSRRHSSGGSVIERAAILADGADSTRVVAWVVAHGGQPETAVDSTKRGLHSPRHEDPAGAVRPPARYVLPAGALA